MAATHEFDGPAKGLEAAAGQIETFRCRILIVQDQIHHFCKVELGLLAAYPSVFKVKFRLIAANP